MIFKESILDVIDNSGAKKANCFATYSAGKYAAVGDVIMVSIRAAIPNAKVKTGEKYKAIIVRTKSPIRRKAGDDVCFNNNAVILINEKGDPIGTRITSLVPREVSQKIRSLAVGVC